MNEMIERIASALQTVPNPSSGNIWHDLARAALEELKIPTEEMQKAGFHANVFENKFNGEWGCPGVKCSVDPPTPEKWEALDKEAITKYLKAPKCLIARLKIPINKPWEIMIEEALKE